MDQTLNLTLFLQDEKIPVPELSQIFKENSEKTTQLQMIILF